MGCGGSRADAFESMHNDSCTRETETTWLTCTDFDSQQAGIITIKANNHGCVERDGPMKENATKYEGKRAEICSSQRDGKLVNAGTQYSKQPFGSSSTSNK